MCFQFFPIRLQCVSNASARPNKYPMYLQRFCKVSQTYFQHVTNVFETRHQRVQNTSTMCHQPVSNVSSSRLQSQSINQLIKVLFKKEHYREHQNILTAIHDQD